MLWDMQVDPMYVRTSCVCGKMKSSRGRAIQEKIGAKTTGKDKTLLNCLLLPPWPCCCVCP